MRSIQVVGALGLDTGAGVGLLVGLVGAAKGEGVGVIQTSQVTEHASLTPPQSHLFRILFGFLLTLSMTKGISE